MGHPVTSVCPADLPPADAELIAASRSGDVAAYGELYQRHVHPAYRLARQFVCSDAEADRVIAESFARILGELLRGNGPEDAFRQHVLATVRLVGEKAATGGGHVVVIAGASSVDPGSAVGGLERRRVARAFGSLPARWRAVLWHTAVEGERHVDVAPLFGLTPKGVAALAYRAREGLRQACVRAYLSGQVRAECGPVAARLGAYVRGVLPAQENVATASHLDECAGCGVLAAELVDVSAALREVVAPMVLGAAAGAYLPSGTEDAGRVVAARRVVGAAMAAGLVAVALTTVTVGIALSGRLSEYAPPGAAGGPAHAPIRHAPARQPAVPHAPVRTPRVRTPHAPASAPVRTPIRASHGPSVAPDRAPRAPVRASHAPQPGASAPRLPARHICLVRFCRSDDRNGPDIGRNRTPVPGGVVVRPGRQRRIPSGLLPRRGLRVRYAADAAAVVRITGGTFGRQLCRMRPCSVRLIVPGHIRWAGLYWSWPAPARASGVALRGPGGHAVFSATADNSLPMHEGFADVTSLLRGGLWAVIAPAGSPAIGWALVVVADGPRPEHVAVLDDVNLAGTSVALSVQKLLPSSRQAIVQTIGWNYVGIDANLAVLPPSAYRTLRFAPGRRDCRAGVLAVTTPANGMVPTDKQRRKPGKASANGRHH